MTDFLQALVWLAGIVLVLPATVYVTLLFRSWLRPTRDFVQIYGLFQMVCFLLAIPIVALSWPLPPPARATIAATIIYLMALAFPATSTMARYPLCAIRYRRLPVVASRFAAGYTYTTPDDPHYAVTPFDDSLFRTPQDAAAAGFRPLHH